MRLHAQQAPLGLITAVCCLEGLSLGYEQRVQESLGQWQTLCVVQSAAGCRATPQASLLQPVR